MKQLTMNVVMRLIAELKKRGYSDEQIAALPVYIGDDDELNGIHTAWYADLIDPDRDEDENIVAMINLSRHNIEITGKAILIS